MKKIKKILLCSTLAFILGFAAIANVNAEELIAKTLGGGSWIRQGTDSEAETEETCKSKHGENANFTGDHCFYPLSDVITLGTFTYRSNDNYVKDIDCYMPFDLNNDGKLSLEEGLEILQMAVDKVEYSEDKYPNLAKLYNDVCVNHKDDTVCSTYFTDGKPNINAALIAEQISEGIHVYAYYCRVELKQKEDGSYYYPQFWMKYSSNYKELNMPSQDITETTTELPFDKFFSGEFTDEVKMRIDTVSDKYELFIYDIYASRYDKVLTTEKPVEYATIGDIKNQIDEALKVGEDEYLYINGLNTGLKICKKDYKDDCLGVFVGDDGYLYINGKRVADLTKNASSKVEWKDECLYIDDESKFCKGDTGTTSNPKTGVATSIILAGTVVIAVTVGTTIVLKRKYIKNI